MANITTADIRSFISARLEAHASPGEINRELALLKRMSSLAIQAGKLYTRPYVPMLAENNVRTGFFEREQFEALRNHLPHAIRPVVTFAYITGWRIRSEVLPLQWRQVDLDAGTVRLDPGTTKNREGRVFHLTGELRALLERQKQLRDDYQRERNRICPWVFHRHGQQIRSFRAVWDTAAKAAGCPGRIPHDPRPTAVRNLVRAGVPERVAMQLTGHKTRSVFERYNIVSDGDLLEAAQRLDSANVVAKRL
jgi:integrase